MESELCGIVHRVHCIVRGTLLTVLTLLMKGYNFIAQQVMIHI